MSNKITDLFSVNSAVNVLAEQLEKMPERVKELDDATTDLAMSTGTTKAQVEALLDTYTNLGDDLKATVTDMTLAAAEWFKQGKSVAETETLLKDTMVLSKISSLSSADATKYLTSVMQGYSLAVDDTYEVVDKLSAVDMASGTDIGSLAEGLSSVADNAESAGISMDRLLGYLAAVGEASREDMSDLAGDYNAIFARMSDIRLSGSIDSSSIEGLTNAENILEDVGIQLRDSQSNFRDFGDILDETASHWSSFNDLEQFRIADAFAGTEHADAFLTLMENYDNALTYTEASMHSSGEAMEKFKIYEDSLAAHTEELENAFIQLSNTFLSSDFLKGLTDLGTTGVKAVDDLVNTLTPLGTMSAIAGGILGSNDLGKTTKI